MEVGLALPFDEKFKVAPGGIWRKLDVLFDAVTKNFLNVGGVVLITSGPLVGCST
jgi:hypothetical protein